MGQQRTINERIENDFSYHAPHGNQAKLYGLIREFAKDYAKFLVANCPASRELSCALTKLDEVVFWGNASIARNKVEEDADGPQAARPDRAR